MTRYFSFAYGAVCYAVFLCSFAYAPAFVGNMFAPKTIDSGDLYPFGVALAVNLGLLTLFAVQHSGMARRGFKRVLTQVVPQHMERATYVLASSLALIAMYLFWMPMPQMIWSVDSEIARTAVLAVYWMGWATVFLATLMIGHFDLFGMRQVWMNLIGQARGPMSFKTPGLYKIVRHPIQMGFLIAFWAAPDMSAGRMLFAMVTTAYIVLAVKLLEERDLIHEFGDRYRAYIQSVPAFFPTGRGERISSPRPAMSQPSGSIETA